MCIFDQGMKVKRACKPTDSEYSEKKVAAANVQPTLLQPEASFYDTPAPPSHRGLLKVAVGLK